MTMQQELSIWSSVETLDVELTEGVTKLTEGVTKNENLKFLWDIMIKCDHLTRKPEIVVVNRNRSNLYDY